MARTLELSQVSFKSVMKALRSGDEVGLCTEADLERMAKSVVAKIKELPVIEHLSSACPGCGKSKTYAREKMVLAWVLDVDGLNQVHHVPRRCKFKECPLRGYYLWANFVAENAAHIWNSEDQQLPNVIMLDLHFGITKAWYQQFTMRLLRQHTTFWGEAEVHPFYKPIRKSCHAPPSCPLVCNTICRHHVVVLLPVLTRSLGNQSHLFSWSAVKCD